MIIQMNDNGNRLFVQLKRGRLWSYMLDVGTMRRRKFAVDDIDRHGRDVAGAKSGPATVKPSKLARRLSEKRKTFKRLGLHYSERATQDAISVLKDLSG
jgi:hypothetical protein